MAFRANQQLREDMWDYRHKSAPSETENVLGFPPSVPKDYGATALNLVQQAAEIFSGMENHARETEARARCDCAKASPRNCSLPKRKGMLRSVLAAKSSTNSISRFQDVTRALQQAEARFAAAEERAIAAQFRAQAVENQLYKANCELVAV